ncbi:XTP/dITP diphosphatase [soil metagenome]
MADVSDRSHRQVLIATTNAGKLQELAAILPPTVDLRTLRDFNLTSPPETGRTFLDNAVLKADYASRMTGIPALADDSGLEVDALDGRPGVQSARYSGPDATDEENNRKLIADLQSNEGESRIARFVCAVALSTPGAPALTAHGYLRGAIVDEPRGSGGFGYDPHFQLDDPCAMDLNGRTLAELSINQKNRLSHRRRAYDRLLNKIRRLDRRSPAHSLLLAID